tara:strand:+ start:541 stop:1182 length:642 start_codon:yes stop_codon:yes gene_type:complete
MINNGFITFKMKSFSEIETTSKRASKAAGFSWGIAEEVGKGIKILELFGLAGVKNLNEYLNSKEVNQYENLNLINENNQSDKYPYCPIIFGVSFLDQVKNIEKLNKIHLNKVAYPFLVLPFLSRSSEEIGKKILYKFDEYSFLLNFNLSLSSKKFSDECPVNANNIEISFLENKDNFKEQDWNSLYKLSEKTFVEETDSLKIGAAGAGLTDND